MRFIIGGKHSGKCTYAENKYGIENIPDADYENIFTSAAVKNFHLFIKRMMSDNTDMKALIDEICEKNPDITIISDEIGYGVIPMDRDDREWRECTGRICCYAAERANTVIRVICGVGTVIK